MGSISTHETWELKFDLPYGSFEPSVVNQTVGINKLVSKPSGSYHIDVTILDTPDNRLLRAGVVLAHRVIDDLGQWYLSAPDWLPWIPKEITVELGASGDLPDQLAIMVRPLRRQLLVGPIAALECDRNEYVLRGINDENLGLIRDDKVSVERGGIIIARYRECTISCSSEMTIDQADFIREIMRQCSATEVVQFPSLQTRLGAPATGKTDFPDPEPFNAKWDLEHFVQQIFACHLREIVAGDLDLRTGKSNAERLVNTLVTLRRDLRGLSVVLDDNWRAEVESNLDPLTELDPKATSLPLLGQRLFNVVDALVAGARAPRLGNASRKQAATLFKDRVTALIGIVSDRCKGLKVTSPPESWAATLAAARQTKATIEVSRRLFDTKADTLLRHISALVDALNDCIELAKDCEVSQLSPQQAFEAGRQYEHDKVARLVARKRFVRFWPKKMAKMRKVMSDK